MYCLALRGGCGGRSWDSSKKARAHRRHVFPVLALVCILHFGTGFPSEHRRPSIIHLTSSATVSFSRLLVLSAIYGVLPCCLSDCLTGKQGACLVYSSHTTPEVQPSCPCPWLVAPNLDHLPSHPNRQEVPVASRGPVESACCSYSGELAAIQQPLAARSACFLASQQRTLASLTDYIKQRNALPRLYIPPRSTYCPNNGTPY